jgi:hypothetical protein
VSTEQRENFGLLDRIAREYGGGHYQEEGRLAALLLELVEEERAACKGAVCRSCAEGFAPERIGEGRWQHFKPGIGGPRSTQARCMADGIWEREREERGE